MKMIFIVLLLCMTQISFAGGLIPIGLMPNRPPGTVLAWEPARFQFDGPTGGQIATLTLINYGTKLSGTITVSLDGGDASYLIVNDNCAMKLKADARCTVDIQYFGSAFNTPTQFLNATDGTVSAPAAPITNCVAC